MFPEHKRIDMQAMPPSPCCKRSELKRFVDHNLPHTCPGIHIRSYGTRGTEGGCLGVRDERGRWAQRRVGQQRAVQAPAALVFARGRQAHAEVVALQAPVQAVEPVACRLQGMLDKLGLPEQHQRPCAWCRSAHPCFCSVSSTTPIDSNSYLCLVLLTSRAGMTPVNRISHDMIILHMA